MEPYKRKIMTTFSVIFILAVMTTNGFCDEWNFIEKGLTLEKEGRFQEALQEFDKALSLNPDRVELYTIIGGIYQRNVFDIEKAIDAYKRGIKFDSKNFSLHYSLMNALSEHGEFNQISQQYKILSELRKEDEVYSYPIKALNNLIKNMTSEEIKKICIRYLSINPSDIVLRNELAEIYLENKEYDNARKELEYLLQTGYSKSGLFFELGVCYYYVGEYQKAYRFLKKAQEEHESVPQQYFEMICEKLVGLGGECK